MDGPQNHVWFRPVRGDPPHGLKIGNAWPGFSQVDVLRRGAAPERLPVDAVTALWPEAETVLAKATAPRGEFAGVDLCRPRVMGIVNTTPDSFSDGGQLADADAAIRHALSLVDAGADFLDIGGESTRPGAEPVGAAQEVDRVLPVIEGLIANGCAVPISIDTRKAAVARAALGAGARIVNDVSALTYDSEMADIAAKADGICLMHAQGDPRTMQQDPRYDDVLLDVFDYLSGSVSTALANGIAPSRVLIDPGIGFGKTVQHNLALIDGIGLFHGLGCPVLLGVSRKGFIGRLSGEEIAANRAPGSIAAGLAGVAAGVQVLRVHDVWETVQALRVWSALSEGTNDA